MPAQVALVCMPGFTVYRPSSWLSQLKANLAAQGIEADTHYLNMLFCDMVGHDTYHKISRGYPSHEDLVTDWIFSTGSLTSTTLEQDREYFETVLARVTTSRRSVVDESFFEELLAARAQVPAFLDTCLNHVNWKQYRLVVLITPFFAGQLCASLSLAKLLRIHTPEVISLIGGNEIEGLVSLAVLRAFPFVGATCAGEWDYAVPEFAQAVLEGRQPQVRGIYLQEEIQALSDEQWEEHLAHVESPAGVANMDELPFPDHSDFFEAFRRARFGKQRMPFMAFESSRGCWWGAKHHCTFCGLNQEHMSYRSKSPNRALAEVEFMLNRFGSQFNGFWVQDTILDMRYLAEFFPKLVQRGHRLDFFYETKANLRKEHFKVLAESGSRVLQPGIESFSNTILRLMRKGVTGLQNIQCLRWSKEYGLRLIYSMLMGFPGEESSEYERMARLIPYISHLQPPGWWGRLRMDRYSPYFNNQAEYGFQDVHPFPSYRYVFPEIDNKVLKHLAYFFEYTLDIGVDEYTIGFREALQQWQLAERQSFLFHQDTSQVLHVWDSRPLFGLRHLELSGLERQIYLLCDEVIHEQTLVKKLGFPKEQIEAALRYLQQEGLVLEDEGCYLALGIPLPADVQRIQEMGPLGDLIAQHRDSQAEGYGPLAGL